MGGKCFKVKGHSSISKGFGPEEQATWKLQFWATHLERFHGNCKAVSLPHADVNLSVLTAPELVLHGDICPFHFPFVMDGGHPIDRGLITLGCRVVQGCHQPVSHCGVMVNKLGQGAKATLSGHVHLAKKKKSDEGLWPRLHLPEATERKATLRPMNTLHDGSPPALSYLSQSPSSPSQ